MTDSWTREKWKEARAAYLESIHVKESEIKHYGLEDYFYFDKVRVWMPDHLVNPTRFAKTLRGSRID